MSSLLRIESYCRRAGSLFLRSRTSRRQARTVAAVTAFRSSPSGQAIPSPLDPLGDGLAGRGQGLPRSHHEVDNGGDIATEKQRIYRRRPAAGLFLLEHRFDRSSVKAPKATQKRRKRRMQIHGRGSPKHSKELNHSHQGNLGASSLPRREINFQRRYQSAKQLAKCFSQGVGVGILYQRVDFAELAFRGPRRRPRLMRPGDAFLGYWSERRGAKRDDVRRRRAHDVPDAAQRSIASRRSSRYSYRLYMLVTPSTPRAL